MPAHPFAGRWGPEAILNSSGTPQPGAPAELRLRGSGTLATLFTDRVAATTALNPTAADAKGNLALLADPGEYDLFLTIGGIQQSAVPITVPADPQPHAQCINARTLGGATSATIQAAIDLMTGSGRARGWPIFLSPEDWNINSVINYPAFKGGKIFGAGWDVGTRLIAANGLNNDMIKFTSPDNNNHVSGLIIEDLVLDHNGANQSAGGCLYGKGAVQCHFNRIHFSHPRNYGVWLDGMGGGAFGHHNRFNGCLFDNAQGAGPGRGALLNSSDENWFFACDFESLGGSGTDPAHIRDECGLNYYIACNFVGGNNNCEGIHIQDASRCRIAHCTFDGVNGHNIWLTGSLCNIVGNTFSFIGSGGTISGGASGVVLDFGAQDNSVLGNVFESSNIASKTRSFVRETGTGGGGNNRIGPNTYRSVAALAQTEVEVPATSLTTVDWGPAIVRRKGANQSVTSSTTLTNVTDMVVPVLAGHVYEVDLFLIYEAGTTGDLKLFFTAPTGATFDWVPGGLGGATTTTIASMKMTHDTLTENDAVGGAGTGTGNRAVARPSGILVVGGTSGDLQLQFAQQASDATSTTILANSFIKRRRIA